MSEAANRLTDETPFGARVFVAEALSKAIRLYDADDRSGLGHSSSSIAGGVAAASSCSMNRRWRASIALLISTAMTIWVPVSEMIIGDALAGVISSSPILILISVQRR
jgi:hypothetical protein